MVAYTKYEDFIEQVVRAKHDFGSATFKVALSNAAPSAAHTTLSQITELATANGYTAGGLTVPVTVAETGGTVTVSCTDPSPWTASGAGITFRYAALYNDTQTSPADALVAFWDNGSSQTVTAGNTLQLDLAATLFTAS